MIPLPAITAWRIGRPWRTDQQVAQDLFLCALATEIGENATTRDALVWRGGTCLHQVHLLRPRRFSEDLDYVLLAGTARYPDLDGAFARIAAGLGAKVVGQTVHTAARYKTWVSVDAARVGPVSVKIEINAGDATPALDPVRRPLTVHAPGWYERSSMVLTYQTPELVGTKFRALAQRRKVGTSGTWTLPGGRSHSRTGTWRSLPHGTWSTITSHLRSFAPGSPSTSVRQSSPGTSIR